MTYGNCAVYQVLLEGVDCLRERDAGAGWGGGGGEGGQSL